MKNFNDLNELLKDPGNVAIEFNKSTGKVTIHDTQGHFTPAEKEELESKFHYMIFASEYLERAISGMELLGSHTTTANERKLGNMKSQLRRTIADYKIIFRELTGDVFER
ncbi:MAG: hypothetical protein ABSG15_08710 [FCB group bacterium]|jgi:hypothetical protein